MGCGTLSTVAVQSDFGTKWPARDQNVLGDKENSNFNIYEDKKVSESSKLSLGYSPLKSENTSTKSRTAVANGDDQRKNGDKISNFNVFVKELDEEKYKNDDGGVWTGTENDVTEAADIERSLPNNVNRDEEADVSDCVKDNFTNHEANIPNNESNSAIPEYASITLDGSDSTDKSQYDKSQNDKATSRGLLPAIFSQSSSKRLRHLQRHRVHFESVEDKFSYSYGHFVDDDKQMSDSELGDCEISLNPRRSRDISPRRSECNADRVVHEQTVYDDDVRARSVCEGFSERRVDKGDSPSESMPSDTNNKKAYSLALSFLSKLRNSQEADTDVKIEDGISEISLTGTTLEDFPTCPDKPLIPHFVFKCASYIEEVGLKTEGIYRLCGNRADAKLFKSNYSADPELDIAVLQIPVTVIATVLKNFFHELREPVIPPCLYEDLIKSTEADCKDSQLLMLGNIVKNLPAQNFEVFKFIITHLSKVAQHQDFNKMTSRNLSKCWWPTLIRLQLDSYEKLKEKAQAPEDIIQIFIEQCALIFHEESGV